MPKGVPKEKPKQNVLFFSADKYLAGKPNINFGGEEDELQKMKQNILKERLAKIKETEADIFLTEQEERLEKMKKKKIDMVKTPSGYVISPLEAAEISKLPEEDRQRAIQTYGALKNAEKSAGGAGGSWMLPVLMGFARNNPGASQNQMMEFMGKMIIALKPPPQQQVNMGDVAKIFEAGINAAKTQNPGTQAETIKSILGFTQPFYQQIYQQLKAGEQAVFNEKMARLESQIVNPLEALKEFKSGIEALGLTGTQQTSVELEKFKAESARDLEKYKQEGRRWEMEFKAKQEADDRKYGVLEKVLSGPLGKTVQTFGQAGADRLRGKENMPKPVSIPAKRNTSQISNPVSITCPACGGTFIESGDKVEVVCPSCGVPLRAEPFEQQPKGDAKSGKPASS